MTSEAAAETADSQTTGRSPETVDRIMVGVCGAIWLILLAVGVVATVALVALASGQSSGGEQSSTLLYAIIAVSALIIIGAVPLLLRARRNALAEPAEAAAETATPADLHPAQPADAPTEKIRVFGVDPYAQPQPEVAEPAPVAGVALDRVWLRGTASLLSAMGLALTAVAAATYLLAVASDTGAWVALGVAAVITVAMPAVLVFHQRMLADVVGPAGE